MKLTKTMNRRVLLAASTSAAAFSFMGKTIYAQTSKLPEISSLRSAVRAYTWAPEGYAIDAGIFEKLGLRVNAVGTTRGSGNSAALQGNDPVIVLGDPPEPIRAREQNIPIRLFCSTMRRFTSMIAVRQEILERLNVSESSSFADKISALKGLKLGTTGVGGGPDALFRYLAEVGGLNSQSDFQLVPIQGAGPALVAALEQGIIDGFCHSSPAIETAVHKFGADYLFRMAKNPPESLEEIPYLWAYTSERMISEQRDLLVKYCAGITLSLRTIHEDPQKFNSWLKEWLGGIDSDIFDEMIDNSHGVWKEDAVPSEASFNRYIDYINSVNRQLDRPEVSRNITYNVMVDETIALDGLRKI